MVNKLWSKVWKSSSQPRKQRKYLHNSPLHVKHKLMAAPLSKDLKKEHGVRSVPVRSGDTVTIRAGQFKGKTGKANNYGRIPDYGEKTSILCSRLFFD